MRLTINKEKSAVRTAAGDAGASVRTEGHLGCTVDIIRSAFGALHLVLVPPGCARRGSTRVRSINRLLCFCMEYAAKRRSALALHLKL